MPIAIDASTITPPCIIWTGRSGTYFCIFFLISRLSAGSFMIVRIKKYGCLFYRLRGVPTQGGSQMRRDRLQQQRMDVGVARADVSGLEIGVIALQVADHAARFGDQQATCGHVPWLEADFEEAVVASRRDPCEIDCGGAGAAQPGGLLYQILEDRNVGIHV